MVSLFSGKKYLNSGFYIGYLKEIVSLLSFILESKDVTQGSDDQNLLHQIYTNETLRKEFNIKLDHKSHMVYNTFLAEHEGEIRCRNRTLRY